MSEILTYVTAFLNIGRDSWKEFSRTNEKYFNDFLPFLDLFEKNVEKQGNRHRFTVYIDSDLEPKITKTLNDRPKVMDLVKQGIIRLILISDSWMVEHIPIWSRLGKEGDLMSSDEYKAVMKSRLKYPEHSVPKYTMINNAKVDFLQLTSKKVFPESTFFCWVDFGFFSKPENIPKSLIDIEKIPRGKILYTTVNLLTKLDSCFFYTLHTAPERIGGFFFCGDYKSIEAYRNLFADTHEEFQRLGYPDDDQHIALRCYYKKPELFELRNFGWHRALVELQKN